MQIYKKIENLKEDKIKKSLNRIKTFNEEYDSLAKEIKFKSWFQLLQIFVSHV